MPYFSLFVPAEYTKKIKLDQDFELEYKADEKLQRNITLAILEATKSLEYHNLLTESFSMLKITLEEMLKQIKRFDARYRENEADPVIMADIIKSLRDFKTTLEKYPTLQKFDEFLRVKNAIGPAISPTIDYAYEPSSPRFGK